MKRTKRRSAAFWPFLLLFMFLACAEVLTRHLSRVSSLIAMLVVTVLVVLLAGRVRARVMRRALDAPAAGEGTAFSSAEPLRRTSELAGAAPVRAAGSSTLSDVIRYSLRAGRYQPGGDPEADRVALLAGQSFRVLSYWKDGRRWKTGELRIGGQPLALTWRRGLPSLSGRAPRCLSLTPPGGIRLARPLAGTREWFPNKSWLFTAVTIDTASGRQVLAVPAMDVPLVGLALEVASAEAPADDREQSS